VFLELPKLTRLLKLSFAGVDDLEGGFIETPGLPEACIDGVDLPDNEGGVGRNDGYKVLLLLMGALLDWGGADQSRPERSSMAGKRNRDGDR
jgi:hypothetical protein